MTPLNRKRDGTRGGIEDLFVTSGAILWEKSPLPLLSSVREQTFFRGVSMMFRSLLCGKRFCLTLALASVMWSFSAPFLSLAVAQEGQPPEVAAVQPAAGAGHQGEGAAPKSRLVWFVESSGWIGAIILLLSMYFIATVARLFVEMRPQVTSPPALLEECEGLLKQRNFKGLFTLLREDDSAFGRVTSAGMSELSNGLPEAREVMGQAGEAVTVDMERKISMLAVLGTLGPMIGLLGTLKGMIASFSVIALSDTQLKASEVAGGISEALLLTFEGVALSVPAIYFYAVFKNRVSTLSVNTQLEADEFIRMVSNEARHKGNHVNNGAAPAQQPQQVVAAPMPMPVRKPMAKG
jgi:biopolymer transport protein ExbB